MEFFAFYSACALAVIALRQGKRKQAPVAEPASAEALRGYFADPSNYASHSINQVIEKIGPYQVRDDWDWGRFVYEWRRDGLRVRVITNSDYVNCVEYLDPDVQDRFGEVIRTIWERPERVEPSDVED